MNNIRNLLVVGGGTAGLISAIILKKRFNFDITVIYSSNVGTIGVGEGSTEHFRDFMNFVGINQYDLIKECDATYKAGIMFQNWGHSDYLHMVEAPFNVRLGDYSIVYAKQIADSTNKFQHSGFWQNKIDSGFLNKPENFPANQFHFNTHKLNDFLKKIASGLGIDIVEDEIEKVFIDEKTGYIRSVKGQKQLYAYDFYIDATGFKRLLISELGAKWNSYGEFLKMKSAITFQTPDEENYNIWTLARAMDSGWLFRIPVWGRYGNGYIFDSDFITAEQAKQEIESLVGREIEVGKTFNFDPGALDRVWINNCCAVGLSGSFVEPLEASSIGTTIQQTFLLMQKLSNYDQRIINEYNRSFNEIMENIRDFIILHYLTGKTNSEFWKSLREMAIPDSLGSRLEKWRTKLPVEEDFSHLSTFNLFGTQNFILIMAGLNLFDRESIKKEFLSSAEWLQKEAEFLIRKEIEVEKNIRLINHKDFISLVRSYL